MLERFADKKLSFKEQFYECLNEGSRMCAVVVSNVKNVDNSIQLFKSFFIKQLLDMPN